MANGSPVVVERQILRDGVYEAVLEILLDNQVAPGESLSIDGLARELGVSPTPVREAFVQLEHTGLVTRAPLKGYRVAPPLSTDRMTELIDARAVIEAAAIRLAVPASPAVIAELEQAHTNHARAARRVVRMHERQPGRTDWATMRNYYNVDWEFHLILLRNCGNGYLFEMAQGLSPQVHRLRQSMHQGRIDVDQAHVEHTVILDAVRDAERDAAEEAMRSHLAAVRERAAADG